MTKHRLKYRKDLFCKELRPSWFHAMEPIFFRAHLMKHLTRYLSSHLRSVRACSIRYTVILYKTFCKLCNSSSPNSLNLSVRTPASSFWRVFISLVLVKEINISMPRKWTSLSFSLSELQLFWTHLLHSVHVLNLFWLKEQQSSHSLANSNTQKWH